MYSFNLNVSKIELSSLSASPGLSIEFAIEQREYLAPVTAKAGIRVVIHPAGTAPFPVDHGIDIGPGRASSVGVRKVGLLASTMVERALQHIISWSNGSLSC